MMMMSVVSLVVVCLSIVARAYKHRIFVTIKMLIHCDCILLQYADFSWRQYS